MQGGPSAVVPSVEREHDVANFRTATFTKNQTVGPHSHGCSHELRQTDPTLALHIRVPFDKGYSVSVIRVEFRNFFDTNDSLVVRDKRQQS